MAPARAVLTAVLFLVLLVPATAAAQTERRGSALTAPNNVGLGCESSVQQFNEGFFLAPGGHPSCTWWSSGIASNPTSPNTGFVRTTGTVTNVRVKSGPNPAPLRIVQLRSTAGCCVGVRHTDPFQPRPNAITQVTVNWPVEVVRDSVVGVSTNDIIGFSSIGNAGSLPLSDQGFNTHTASAAFAPGVHSGTMTVPRVDPGTAIAVNYRAAIGYEPLLQYDFVPCPARSNMPVARAAQAGCPAAAPAPQPAPPPPVVAAPPSPTQTAPPPVVDLRSTVARLRGSRIALTVACLRSTPCRGRLRLRTRGARPRLIASAPLVVAAGRSRTIRARVGRAQRRLLRRRARTPLTAELDLGGGTKIVEQLTFRR